MLCRTNSNTPNSKRPKETTVNRKSTFHIVDREVPMSSPETSTSTITSTVPFEARSDPYTFYYYPELL
jgi:hypothetical protein